MLDEFILRVTADNKYAGKLDIDIWARRDEDERVEKWLLIRGARRRLSRRDRI
jgi:hypothetical protein